MLIRYLTEYHDELEADFQQFYGLDLNDLGRSLSVRHAAVLAAQLPITSRCCIAQEPDLAWSTDTWLLRRIDHGLSLLLWSMSKHKGQKPQPVNTPGETAKIRKSVENTDFDLIAERLGVRDGNRTS